MGSVRTSIIGDLDPYPARRAEQPPTPSSVMSQQWFRLLAAIDADDRHEPVWVAWQGPPRCRVASRPLGPLVLPG